MRVPVGHDSLRLPAETGRPVLVAAIAAALSACAPSPSFMHPAGPAAHSEAVLGWTLTLIASAVVVVVTVLVVVGSVRAAPEAVASPVTRRRAIRWILVGGVAVPIVVLLAAFVFSTVTLTAITHPPSDPALVIRVIGHRWWWELNYQFPQPTRDFTTANELHVPVGLPVRIELETADVIHSFWIPRLAGKMDLVPGGHTAMWLEADEPGVYYGQCAEYCGTQHANMRLRLVAAPTAEFVAWAEGQAQDARAVPDTSEAGRGRQAFAEAGCAACHTIRGTGAAGEVGPDLTHFASRGTLGAGILPNTTGHLMGWIADAQALKPGNLMPTMYLPPPELQALATYLEALE